MRQVDRLQSQVKDQEESLVAQEQELADKRRELTELRDQELSLERQVKETAERQERVGRTMEDAALQLSQVRQSAQSPRRLGAGVGRSVMVREARSTSGLLRLECSCWCSVVLCTIGIHRSSLISVSFVFVIRCSSSLGG